MCLVYGIVQLINNTPKVTDPRVRAVLDPEEVALYESTTKPSKLCGSMLSALTATAGFGVEREVHLNEMLGLVAGNVSMCARIKLQAMPSGGRARRVQVGAGAGGWAATGRRAGAGGRAGGCGRPSRVQSRASGAPAARARGREERLWLPHTLHPAAPSPYAGMSLFCTGWTYIW
jgi:hypothetical protein